MSKQDRQNLLRLPMSKQDRQNLLRLPMLEGGEH